MRAEILTVLSSSLLAGCGVGECVSFRTVQADEAVRLANADPNAPISAPGGGCEQRTLRAPSSEREVDDVRTVGSGL
jgi:hypothetical protein